MSFGIKPFPHHSKVQSILFLNGLFQGPLVSFPPQNPAAQMLEGLPFHCACPVRVPPLHHTHTHLGPVRHISDSCLRPPWLLLIIKSCWFYLQISKCSLLSAFPPPPRIPRLCHDTPNSPVGRLWSHLLLISSPPLQNPAPLCQPSTRKSACSYKAACSFCPDIWVLSWPASLSQGPQF